MFMVPCIAELY